MRSHAGGDKNFKLVSLTQSQVDSRSQKMSNKLVFLVVALTLSLYVENSLAFKVLGILPFASKSHHSIGSSILKSLTEVGHEVTVISAFPLKTKEKNYHDIKVTRIMEVFERGND